MRSSTRTAPAKSRPPKAQERLLLEPAVVATEEVKQVAQQRAQAARDYLRDRRRIANELTGARRVDYGKPATGTTGFFTLGLRSAALRAAPVPR